MFVQVQQQMCVFHFDLSDILGWLPSDTWADRVTHLPSLFGENGICFWLFFSVFPRFKLKLCHDFKSVNNTRPPANCSAILWM